jgi:DNA-binding response OmpR family regulator
VTRILLVEDEPLVAATLSEMLEEEGFEVRTAFDGAEGLNASAEFAPDLIISDFMMPRMSGSEMITRLRAQGGLCPIILMSAITNLPRDYRPAHNAFLQKPFSLNVLIDRVKQLLQR